MLTTIMAVLALTAFADDDDRGGASPEPVLQLDAARSTTEDENRLGLSAAGEYAAYHRVIADLRDAPIGSAADLDSAMDRLTTFYSDDRLVRAWIAYTAVVAAQHPEYLDDVREVADYYGPQAAMSGLIYDPAYATSFRHAGAAQASVIAALEEDSAEIREVSERYRAAAYDLQSSRWANSRARDRQDRLAAINAASSREIALSDEDLMSLEANLNNGVSASALFAPTQRTTLASASSPQLSLTVGQRPVDADRVRVGRILSVAALQAISTDSSHSAAAMDSLLSDPQVERCMAWVRLDLQQCVAAGHFKYEDSFCIAEHALLDVSRCLGAAASSAN
jgi:hypothetical protein